MSITYNETHQTLTIQTAHSTYQMVVNPFGYLLHNYYGASVPDMDMSYLHMGFDRGFCGNPPEAGTDRTFSPDVLPQEYTGYGMGDYRINSIAVSNADGSLGCDFRYEKYEIREGKYSLPGLPAVYDKEGRSQTLIVTVRDQVTGLTADLLYGVFEEEDIITRTVVLRNEGNASITVGKAGSVCLDLPYGDWDMIHFHGKHTLERQTERAPLSHAVKSIGSKRGTSSHQQNPFVILCDREATEKTGACYGCMLVYSGSFKAEVELDPFDSVRVVMGIQDEGFSWNLNPGETFAAPEVIMTYAAGLNALSWNYHRIIRNNLCRGRFQHERRPVLINSWEAAYFDFDEKTLLKLAEEAKELGIELLVMDDGWFGVRNDDNRSLGDWYVNENKLHGGLKPLVDKVNALGMEFGIWMEPECVNEDSDLFRAHPDWALTMPGRRPARSRYQLVLDLTRADVRDYLFERIKSVLSESNITYVKWDMNRSLADVYSHLLPEGQQGEVFHRYVLGLYDLLERFNREFPNVLLESCSGGGGRFDAGMLYYAPQVWCSDDTDPIHRLNIQYGTSFGYPISTVGSHVSASPNHQTGRHTPFHTRGVVAMSGTFGYELDPAKLSDEEKNMIRGQIADFKEYYDLIQNGRYYRLSKIRDKYYEAWSFVSEDRKEVLLNIVITEPQPNPTLIHLKLAGLDPDALYTMTKKTEDNQTNGFRIFGNKTMAAQYRYDASAYSGRTLMEAGYTVPWLMGDYPALQIYLQKTE